MPVEVALSPASSRAGRAMAVIRQNLANGRFKVGELLPPEQDLAVRLGVSRGTLRAALKELEDEGLLRAEARRGRVVVRTQSASSGLMASTVALLSWTQVDQAPRRKIGHGMLETEFGVLDALAAESLHSMVLHPHRLTGVGMEQLLRDRPLGVVVSHRVADTPGGPELIRRLVDQDVPVVFNGNHEGLRHVDRVSSDHRSGAAELTRALLARGYRRILRLWEVSPSYWLLERNEGYEQAMREAGVKPLPAVYVPGAYERQDADPDPCFDARMTMVAGLLVPYLTGRRRIDAVMVHTDAAALATAEACRQFGVRVHEDVAVVGYDDNWDGIEDRPTQVTPPLLTVDKQNSIVGREMLRLLLARVRGEASPEPQHAVVSGRLVEVGPMPARRSAD